MTGAEILAKFPCKSHSKRNCKRCKELKTRKNKRKLAKEAMNEWVALDDHLKKRTPFYYDWKLK